MNERAERLITEAGEELLSWMQSAEGFAVEQAPLLAQEIVRWGVWSHAAAVLVCCFFLCLIWGFRPFIRNVIKKEQTTWDYLDELAIFGIALFISIIPVIILSVNASVALKVLIAPRLYIMEQLGGML